MMTKRERLEKELIALRKELTQQFNVALRNGQPTSEIERLRSQASMMYFKLNRK